MQHFSPPRPPQRNKTKGPLIKKKSKNKKKGTVCSFDLSLMKKQKKIAEGTSVVIKTTNSKKKKVTKREVDKQSTNADLVVAVAEEKASHGGDRAEGSSSEAAAAAAAMVEDAVMEGSSSHGLIEDWRAWWRPEMLVDEQMSWGSVWFSFWEQECDNCHAFYSDVLEEDDIWDLRSIKQVPQ